MKNLWQMIFGSAAADTASNQQAKSRLHFVLVQDRSGLNSQEMASFKEELVSVVGKYFQIEKDAFDISYKREGDATALVINSPVLVRKTKGKGGSDKEEKKTTGSAEAAPAAV